jgi:hypothetical protein
MENPDLSLLQLKIANIGTALFFCGDNNCLPFSAYIITALRTDEEGCIWFLISRGWNKPVSYDTLFPVSLEFYRKGYPFTLKIEGDAGIVNDKTVMQDLMGKSIRLNDEAFYGVLLVKVKIKHSEYKELQAHKSFRPLQFSLSALKNFLLPNHEKRETGIQWQPAV